MTSARCQASPANCSLKRKSEKSFFRCSRTKCYIFNSFQLEKLTFEKSSEQLEDICRVPPNLFFMSEVLCSLDIPFSCFYS